MSMGRHANLSIFVPHVGCPHKCSFCNQNTITGQTDIPRAKDVKAVCEKAVAQGLDISQTEIAFFGGSFTAVPRAYMTELLEAAKPYVEMGFKGIRCSTRPDAISTEILDILKDYGITAIELGAQSMCDDVLLMNERGHTSRDVEAAARFVKQYGFTLGLQMMVGLYGSTIEKDIETAHRLIALEPSEARIYPTVVLKNTKLGELYQAGTYRTYPLNDAVALCAELLEMFNQAGIKVIKLGLHSSQDVEWDMLGGIYHPAFRELCESYVYRNKMERLMSGEKECTFTVPPQELSKALGQHRSNIEYFRNKGIKVSIKPNPNQVSALELITNIKTE